MKNILSISILFLLSFFQALLAQHHDFDSLYKHDKVFKKEFKTQGIAKDLFSSEQIMKITIESDFKNLVKRKYKDEYQPAVLRYFYYDTIVVNRDIEIKPRGNMRKSSCFFPPLKLNFPKKDVAVVSMKEFDKMKVVLDCKRGTMYEQYVLSEYYAYKILNILTEYSFRVRLIQMTYVDTSEKYKTNTRYAFIIESKEQMADRLNAIPIDTKNIRDQLTDVPTVINAYLFQYLIGNTDWSIPGRHNIQMIKSHDPTKPKPFVIPYDFDYAGIVNTNYAIPDENLGIKSVRERVYRGVCFPEASVKNGVKQFLEKKDEIYSIYENDHLMDKNNKRNTFSYLNEFYKIIESENSAKRYILDSCR